jgi:hypothetical protein
MRGSAIGFCRMKGSRAGPAGESALRGMLLSLALPERPTAFVSHKHALLRSPAVDVPLEGEQSIHGLAAAIGRRGFTVRAARNAHGGRTYRAGASEHGAGLTVTAELTVELLTISVPVLAVVAPSSCCWR